MSQAVAMNIASLSALSSSNRTALVQMLTGRSTGSAEGAAQGAQGLAAASGQASDRGLPPPPPAGGGADAESMFKALLSSLDTDGDGAVTEAEAQAAATDSDAAAEAMSQLFAGVDGNSDGSLSGDEVDAFASAAAEALGGPGGPPPGGPPPGGPPPGEAGGAEGTGSATAAEDIASLVDAIASALDTDGDGTISAAELAAAMATEGDDAASAGQAAASAQNSAAAAGREAEDLRGQRPSSQMESIIRGLVELAAKAA